MYAIPTHGGGVHDRGTEGTEALAVARLQLEDVGGARPEAVYPGPGAVAEDCHGRPLLGRPGHAGGSGPLDGVHDYVAYDERNTIK